LFNQINFKFNRPFLKFATHCFKDRGCVNAIIIIRWFEYVIKLMWDTFSAYWTALHKCDIVIMLENEVRD
jgi:hypothetical protein